MKDLLGDEPYVPAYLPPYQSHSSTSREAAHSIAPRVTELQRRVLDYLKEHPEGATDEQLVDGTGLGGSTLRPRRRELQKAGHIIKHPTLHGRTRADIRAQLWILKPQLDQVPPSKWWQRD